MKFPSYFPRLFRPPVYQGPRHSKEYFEGWYYKHVSNDGSQVWSIIFGISHSDDPHSFIQIIEGKTGRTDYIRFSTRDFVYEKNRLFISIGKNVITQDSISLDLAGDHFSIQGAIDYSNLSPFPQLWKAPGIMGWYTYAPFMECYHAVVSMNHSLSGSFLINGTEIDFTGGSGYIEKDWGKSMPSDWVWVQCNHFPEADTVSLMISIARIPWLRGFFPGFLSFIKVGNQVYQFATYNRSEIQKLTINEEFVDIEMANRKASLEVRVTRNTSGELKAPVSGKMERKIAESLDAEMFVKLCSGDGKPIFVGKGFHTGLEVVGDVSQYLT
ncbi:tocopherol cyclase family protein [Bacteroidota bacterium]